MGCQIFKRGVQNHKDFRPKINILKAILEIEMVESRQILGIISENKPFPKLIQ